MSAGMLILRFIALQNLSQQSDVTDLLGGFKPISPRYMCMPLYKEFEELFSKTFSAMVISILVDCDFYTFPCLLSLKKIHQHRSLHSMKVSNLHCSKEGCGHSCRFS